MTNTLLVLCFLLLTGTASAQQDTSASYHKFSGRSVTEADSADFVRIITKDTIDKTLWKVQDFYRNGTMLRIGQCSDEWGRKFEKQSVEFYSSGRRKSISNFQDGRKEGMVFEYYPNGTLYTAVKYQKDKVIELVQCKDSTGVNLAKDGDGKWITFDGEFKNVIRSGQVVSGLEEGEWIREINGIERSVFKFNKGKLVSGTYYDDKGKPHLFNDINTYPEYKGGAEKFYAFTKRSIVYPNTAMAANVEGKVRVSFIVEKDGSLKDIQTTGTRIGYGLEEEAITVVRRTAPWDPGFQNGAPVRMKYLVTVVFTLKDDSRRVIFSPNYN